MKEIQRSERDRRGNPNMCVLVCVCEREKDTHSQY